MDGNSTCLTYRASSGTSSQRRAERTGFNPEQDLEQEHILSLSYRAHMPPRFNHEGFHAELGMGLGDPL